MIRAYLDSSVVAAYFSIDALSDTVVPALSEEPGAWWVSERVGVELASVLGRRAREGLLSHEDAAHRMAAYDRYIAEGLFRSRPLAPATSRAARELLLAASTPLRALDALHLAFATALRTDNEIDSVWTGDGRMATAAHRSGLACRLFECP